MNNPIKRLWNKLLVLLRIKEKPLNVELLQKVRQQIVDHPETYSYAFYLPPYGGSSVPRGCIAYHACNIAGVLEDITHEDKMEESGLILERVVTMGKDVLNIRTRPDLIELLITHHVTLDLGVDAYKIPYQEVKRREALAAIDKALSMYNLM